MTNSSLTSRREMLQLTTGLAGGLAAHVASDADEVIALIQKAGRKVVPIPGDIRDEEFCRKLVQQAVTQLRGLDILVNNAARQVSRDSILEITSEQFDATFKTNIYVEKTSSTTPLPKARS